MQVDSLIRPKHWYSVLMTNAHAVLPEWDDYTEADDLILREPVLIYEKGGWNRHELQSD